MKTADEVPGYVPLCGSCGHNLSGTALAICPECGVPRGGRRFASEPTERLLALARALRLMRCARHMLVGLLVGVVLAVAGLAILVLQGAQGSAGGGGNPVPSDGGLSGGGFIETSGEWLIVIGPAAALLALVGAIGVFLVGVWTMDRATGDDSEFSRVVGRLRIATVSAVVVIGTLGAIRAEPSLGYWALALAALATASLAMHVWALANVRFVCMRRIGAWGSRVALWSNAVLIWCLLGCVLTFVTGASTLANPLVVIVFLVAASKELGQFAPVEAHVNALLKSREA